MSNIIEISINDYIKTKDVKLGDHVFRVRKIGAGDRLDISAIANRLMKAGRDVSNSKSKMQALAELGAGENAEEIEKILSDLEKGMQKVEKITDEMDRAYARLFDDFGDQSKSIELVKKVGSDNIPKILDQIFGEKVDG